MSRKALVFFVLMQILVWGGLLGVLIWDHQRFNAAIDESLTSPLVLRPAHLNALAEAMGCPDRGVSGDLVVPLIERLTKCAREQRKEK